ncbi:DUF4012 domain-containing protein [Cryobacterium sp. HLT2-28]|uniref:DUF4012 domain-containing protein n=1 Tax=Cryobacterium sp. HLT2-28 TaxID=1259146 RepID=UPI00106C606C|nr:DUF4012 domain-containing protein [Cryobacterium sp. HLT2-28]TFB95890.1 DUF4012 domain-containing protein [Cryobacterium sp. HLT2-28]
MSLSQSTAGARMRRSRRRRVGVWICTATLVLAIGAGTWVGVRGSLAKGELETAMPLASKIQGEILSGHGAEASATAAELGRHLESAASLTGDPIWRAFEALPVVGPTLAAVRQFATVADDVARGAVRPLAEVAGAVQLADLKPVGGAISLKPLVDAQQQLAAANAALVAANKAVARIDTSATLPVVRDARVQLSAAVDNALKSISNANRAVQLVPNMLGRSGPRNYVLLFQNPAEPRATGGSPSALALLHTENGQISLARQASSNDFPPYEKSVLDLPTETRGLYGDITGQYIQDVNLTPNFPQSAMLAREMWKRQFGVEADGVISLDPVTLGYLLRATGPIMLATSDVLTADNAVQLLLTDVYARYEDPAEQDAFFAAAAASVFSAVSSGNADPKALIEALAQAGSEHRVLVWSAHAEDQALLADTTLAGGLPVSDASGTRFGVYLNDATGSKMGVYLDTNVDLGQATCRNDKRPSYGVSVTLTNTAPADAATSLSDYVTGAGFYGVPPGNVKTVLSVYGAPGMQNLGVTRDGAVIDYHPATDATYPVSSLGIELAPGESAVLHFNWLGDRADSASLIAQMTPGIHTTETGVANVTCESPLW